MRKHAVATAILLLSGTWASAQTVSGTIFGTVRDTSGALIPDVKVVATSVEMGTTRGATTDSSGAYKIPGVPAGVYEVEASTKGFKTEQRSGAVVTVGGTTAVDFVLKLGQMQEKVEVVASTQQVETTNATISGLVGESQIRELPLNGRDWLQLATLQPGVIGGVGQLPASGSSTSSRSARGNGLSISISGGRGTQNVFLIDGLIVNDYANAGPGSSLGVNLGVDAIREFSVLTSNYAAEYGFGSGGMVNAILKSGTNQLHGGAFYFGRNSALDARNFFDPNTIPPFRRHQFGGSLGGPIKKGKTFFFANFEALRQFLSASEASDTLSPNARMGILVPPDNNVIVDPKIVPFLKAFPLPNGPITGETGKFFFGGVEIGNEYYVVGKIDHNFSDKTTLNGSYSFDNAANTVPDPYNEKLIDTPSRRQNVVLSLQHIFSPALLNTLRAGVSRTHAADAFDLKAVSPNPLVTDPAFGFVPGLPAGIITVAGTSGFAGGLGASGADIYNFTAPQVSDDLTWIRGRHSMKFGFAVDRIIFNDVAGNTPNGEWDYGSISDFLTNKPLDFTSDFPGTNGVRHLRTTALGAYVQDDFRVRPNLTLNLGLRYEMATVIKETDNKLANLRNLTDAAPVLGNPYFMNPTLRDFEPRVGFSWDPKGDGKSAVRGGFGVFDILPLPYIFINQTPRSLPFFLSGFVSNPSGNAFPGNGLSLLLPTSLRTVFVQFRPPRAYNMNWNLNIQRQIANNLTLTIGYVGSSTVHSPIISDDINLVPPSLVQKNASGQYVFPIPASGVPAVINPNFARIQSTLWNGKGDYHALLANLVKNFSHGVSFQVTYTWSRSFDEGSATFGRDENLAGVTSPWPFDARLNRGPSDYDVPQNLVLNYTWQVPRPSSVQSAVPKFLFSGWQLGGIYQAHSGTPFTITLSGDPAFTGTTVSNAERPNFNPGPGCGSNPVNPGQPSNYIKLQCFSFPAPGVLGNVGRNTLRGPFIHELDFSLFKNDVVLSDRLKIQFRIECFNLLNHANFQPASPQAFDSSGNAIPAAAQIGPPTLTTSRQIQYGIKLSF